MARCRAMLTSQLLTFEKSCAVAVGSCACPHKYVLGNFFGCLNITHNMDGHAVNQPSVAVIQGADGLIKRCIRTGFAEQPGNGCQQGSIIQ